MSRLVVHSDSTARKKNIVQGEKRFTCAYLHKLKVNKRVQAKIFNRKIGQREMNRQLNIQLIWFLVRNGKKRIGVLGRPELGHPRQESLGSIRLFILN